MAFVRYNRHDLHKPRANQVAPEPVCSYAAFVLRAGKHEPEFVPLGAAREIESLLAAWRRDIARQDGCALNVSARTGEDLLHRAPAQRSAEGFGTLSYPDSAMPGKYSWFRMPRCIW